MTRLYRAALSAAQILAMIGGAVLTALILITCLSILGRTVNAFLHSDFVMGAIPGLAQSLIDLGIGSIRGDFELVEAGMAFCIFLFLPLTQLTASHASVDLLVNALPKPVTRFLIFLAEILFAVMLVIIAQQLFAGLERKMSSGETSLLLQFPIWWSYLASLLGAIAAAATGGFTALFRAYELITGHTLISAEGADH